MSVRELIPELSEKAKTELNEDQARIPEDIQHIKDWLKTQPHIKARTDDQWILAFLRGCKFDLEKTKEKIDFFYTVRTMLPEFFTNRDPMRPEIQEILKEGIFLPFLREDPSEPSMVLMRPCYDMNKVTMEDVLKVNMMAMDIGLMEDDSSMINGGVVFQDMDNMTLAQMAPPALAKKATLIFHYTYPQKPASFHVFNLPSFFDTLYEMFEPFMTDQMKTMINIYTGGTEELFKKIPQKRFPKEYGGEGPTIAELTEMYKKKVEGYRDWFIEDDQYGVDESKRPGKPKTTEEVFNMEGSFGKLNVD